MAYANQFDGFRLVQTLDGSAPVFRQFYLEGGTTGPPVAPTALIQGMIMRANDDGRVEAADDSDTGLVGAIMTSTDSTAAQDDRIPIMLLNANNVFRANASAAVTGPADASTDLFLYHDLVVSGSVDEYQVNVAASADDHFFAIDGNEDDDTLDVVAAFSCVMGGVGGGVTTGGPVVIMAAAT